MILLYTAEVRNNVLTDPGKTIQDALQGNKGKYDMRGGSETWRWEGQIAILL